jgi:hypothetical protein
MEGFIMQELEDTAKEVAEIGTVQVCLADCSVSVNEAVMSESTIN